MRFHVLGLPHTVTSRAFNACAYTQKIVKFGKMMTERGHEVIHYGHEDSDLTCTEHVTVLTRAEWEKTYGTHDWKGNFFKFDLNDFAYRVFSAMAIAEIEKRKRPNDFILPFWGVGSKAVCDAHPDLICVEPGIGYGSGHWARWKVFESYAIYHAVHGTKAISTCTSPNYDVVIPNYFDLADFEFNSVKQDYFLFIGRVYSGKGIDVAIQATAAAGVKLVVAGQNSLKSCGYETVPEHVEEVGYADVETRKRLMSNAKAAILPSQYHEPFGGTQIECLLSGTPTITTDWGAFSENNLHGVTGYRCRTFDHYVWAIKNIDRISPHACREFAERNFSLERVSEMYEEYFQSVLDVYTDKGWYRLRPERQDLHWLQRWFPSAGDKEHEHKDDADDKGAAAAVEVKI
jgi:glycosyltransferase involved in cell wall biosynthesis